MDYNGFWGRKRFFFFFFLSLFLFVGWGLCFLSVVVFGEVCCWCFCFFECCLFCVFVLVLVYC